MAIETERGTMTGDEMVALTKRHTLFEWSAQAKVDPIPVAGAKGVYFWTPEGKRYLDFNSQLMCTNIGHGASEGDRRHHGAGRAAGLRQPLHGHRAAGAPRREAGRDHPRRHRHLLLHQRRRRGQRERHQAGPHSSPAGTRSSRATASYHGGTAGAISLTGDPRRWAAEPGIPGVIRVMDPYHGIQRGWDSADEALANLEETIQLEGPHTIAAFILETVTGTNGILVPPDGYLQGVREICDRHGILMIADEVMAGFGRTGKWFAVDHWNVVPDLITMAKGLTSAYVPARGARHATQVSPSTSTSKVFYGGLTYNSHPLACATALATIAVYEDEDLIERAAQMGESLKRHHAELAAKHPSVGATRSIGLFGIVELVRNREPRWSRWRPSTAPLTRWRRSESASATRASTPSSAGTPSSRTRR